MKKITAILLSLLMLMQIGAFAGEEKAIAGGTVVSSEEMELLSALDIIEAFEDNEYHNTSAVTRAEMARLACMLVIDEAELPQAKGNVFSDVPIEHWAADSIEFLYSIGSLSGNGSGRFRPDEPALYEETVKLFVTVLGHQIRAERKAEYPNGYIAIGMNIGLLDKVKGSAGKVLTYADMYKMLFNAVTSKRLVEISYGESTEYAQSGVTLLESRYNTYEFSGRVDADENSSLKSNFKEEKGRIRIDGASYKVKSGIDVENLLGIYVSGYAREINGDMVIIVLEKDEDREITTIKAMDILDRSGGFGNITGEPKILYNNEKGKTVTVKIPKTASIIRNGVYTGRASEVGNSVVIPDSGYIEILENKDGTNDVVRVYSYVYYVIEFIDTVNLRLTDVYGKSELILDRKDVNCKIYNKGMELKFGDLIPGDVLEICADNNDLSVAENIVITRIHDTVYGMIEIMGEDEFTINGTEYTVSPAVQYEENMTPEIGMSGTFYLGSFGEIVLGVLNEKNPEGYAYLTKMNYYSKGLSKNVYLELYTTNAKLEVMEFDEKVSLNGASPKDKMEVAKDSAFWKGTEVNKQLVRIRRNFKGYITDIYTEANGGVELNESGLREIYINRYTIGPKYLGDEDTWYFVIPTFDDAEESDYGVQTLRTLGSGTYDGISVYDTDEYCVAGCVVKKVGSTFMSIDLGSTSTALVKRITYSVNSGEDCARIHVIIDGEENYFDMPRDEFNKMKDSNGDGEGDTGVVAGDVILCRTDANRLVTEWDILFDSVGEKDRIFSEWYVSTAGMTEDYTGNGLLYTVHGHVGTLKGNILLADVRVKVNGAYQDTVRPYSIRGVRVYVYEEDTHDKVRVGYLGELSKGDRIFMRGTREILREIIIYK